jgi:hypothetical protein
VRKSSLSALLALIVLFLVGCVNNDLRDYVAVPSVACAASYDYGYTDRVSYFPGEVLKAFIQSKENVPLCKLDIFRITGEWAFTVASPMSVQPFTETDPSVNGFGLQPTVAIKLPQDLKSGIYLIEHATPFVVKPLEPVEVMVVYPSNTANAYCESGGKSLYTAINRPSFVSFHRPIPVPFHAEFGLKWFSSLPELKVGFVADIDLNNYDDIRNSKILVIAGHSEYWTRRGRESFDRFVNEGGHALILSGNTMWWQVRYSPGKDKLVRYANDDPEPDPLMRTVNWCNQSLQYPITASIGADFNHGGYGTKTDAGWDGYKITSPNSPLLEGTGLRKGDILNLPSGEYDGAPISGFDTDQFPLLNLDSLRFNKIELIGFDRGSRFDKETIGTFIVFKRSETSGIVVNGASYDWCSNRGMGGQDGDRIQKITRNAINRLLTGRPVFSN